MGRTSGTDEITPAQTGRGGSISLAAVLLVTGVAAIVAFSTSGFGLLVPGIELDAGWSRAVRLAGATIAAAGLAVLLAQRKRLRRPGDRGRDPTAAALATAGTIMGVLFLLALVAPRLTIDTESANPEDAAAADSSAARRSGGGDGTMTPRRNSFGFPFGGGLGRGASRGGGGGGLSMTDDDGERGGGMLEWLGRLLLLLLLVGVTALSARALSRRPGSPAEPRFAESPLAAAAEAGLHASLAELSYDGPDPRRQITAAYHRLLAALTAAGAAREPQEAPHEHLHRSLGPLGVPPEPMHRLTELYVLAQFSTRPITERHRTAAADALAVGLHSLRAVSPA